MDDTAPVQEPRIVVWGVVPDDPPYRVVQVGETVVGNAYDLTDVVEFALHAGLRHPDVDDPSVVRWVGGGKYRWVP